MPRNYKRTTTRQSWSEVDMGKAIKSVLDGNMGYSKASKTHNVPQSTLEDRVKKARKGILVEEASMKVYMGRFRTVFTPDQERELAAGISTMESRLFGSTMLELRTMAYDFAVKNGVGNKFDGGKKMAGKDWLQGFLKRHTELTLKSRERQSVPSATTGFTREAIANFFHILRGLYEKYKFSPLDIYNAAEAGITTVPNKPSKIMAIRGGRQIGTLASAEREESLVTTEICMSAAGIFMPTMFIFPSKKENPTLLTDALPGSTAEYNETGSIKKDLFLEWFKKFVRFANPSIEKPVLLILDGQASHNKNLEVFKLASENNVILLSFPPNCADKMQPLDISFMRSLSVHYEQEVQNWLSTHPGCFVTIHQVGKLFGSAFMTAAVMGTAINGFRRTGIYPFDPDVFPDHLFPETDITDEFIPSNDSMENFEDTDDTPWLPENSEESRSVEIIASQPSTSRDSCFGLQSPNLVNDHHERTKEEAENDEIKEEDILICSPYKFELESAIADLTQQQTRISACKRRIFEEPTTDSKKLRKKQREEYNAIVGTGYIHDNSSSEEDKNL